jgi:quinohemoprotein ethanol dehydrogenase
VEKGSTLFETYCVSCHQVGLPTGYYSQYPNLARLTSGLYDALEDILLGGALSQNGMASFADVLTTEDVQAIRHFLVKEQRIFYGQQQTTRKVQ